MIIKRPETGDISRLTALWQAAFGDTPEDIADFFTTAFSPERSSIAIQDNDLLGALYWFDCRWQEKKLAYLYAVATDESHRDKGVCRQLMNQTHAYLTKNGYHGAILEPADNGLVEMYSKLGYAVCCPVMHYKAPETEAISTMTGMEYMAQREQFLPSDAVLHTRTAFRYMQTQLEFFRFDGGIGCGFRKDGILHLQERLPIGMPVDHTHTAMYLPLDGSQEMPSYFSLDLA